MLILPTYEDLFGGSAEAVTYYKALFTVPTDDQEIEFLLNSAYMKIDPLFGEFREYEVGEDTVRNDHVKRAVCYEANTMYLNSLETAGVVEGINSGEVGQGQIISEKVEDVATTFSDKSLSKGIGLGDSGLMIVLGLVSHDAAVLLSRYIRKTYPMAGHI